jgi:hypothetical protein
VKARAELNIANNEKKVKGKKPASGLSGKNLIVAKKLNNTESLILAQDERWRSA